MLYYTTPCYNPSTLYYIIILDRTVLTHGRLMMHVLGGWPARRKRPPRTPNGKNSGPAVAPVPRASCSARDTSTRRREPSQTSSASNALHRARDKAARLTYLHYESSFARSAHDDNPASRGAAAVHSFMWTGTAWTCDLRPSAWDDLTSDLQLH